MRLADAKLRRDKLKIKQAMMQHLGVEFELVFV